MAHLLRRDGVTPAQAEKLDLIDGAAGHLLSIINDILDLSKIESGKFLLEESDIELDVLLASVTALLSSLLKAKGLRLEVASAEMPGPLRGDATRLTQALLNYANNAIKFTEKGRVSLRAHVLEESAMDVLLRFEVEDTGIGIAPENMERLFAIFEQGDNSNTRKFGGTGLGLAITRRLAQLMGGDAGASSEPGVGSLFWFTARLRKGMASAVESPRPAHEDAVAVLSQDYRGRRVLLADDDPVNQTIAVELLRDVGLEVDVANDGQEAVDMAGLLAYDLILLDVQMPGMDGLEAARRIRRISGRAAVPILAMTSNAFTEDRVRSFEAGMNDHLAKPVMPDALYEHILKWLGRREIASM